MIISYGKHISWLLLCLSSLHLLWSVYCFHFLPLKFFLLFVLTIIIICALLILTICSRRNNHMIKGFGCGVSLLLFICMLFMNFKVVNKAYETVEAVSNGDIKTTEISVLVKKDSMFKRIKDLDGQRFGILKNIDRDNTDFMLNRLSSQFNNEISKVEYKEFKDELQGLLDGKTDAIIMNEGMRDAFNVIDGSFEKETRVLYTLDRKEVLKNLKANNIIKVRDVSL